MVTIRPAVVGDAVELASLAAEAIRATYAHFAHEEVYEAVIAQTCTPAAFSVSILSAEIFLVAVSDGLVGFLDFGDGELRRLYARTGETGRGIGAQLLAALEAGLAPGATYQAIVHRDNVRGLAFWHRHGFVTVGTVDVAEHFSDHRGLGFDAAPEEPALVLARTVP